MTELQHWCSSVEMDVAACTQGHKRKFDQLDPETSKVFSGSSSDDELCDDCLKIDFERTSNIRRKKNGVMIAELGRKTSEWSKAACPMCRLFAAVLAARVQPNETFVTDTSDYHLRAFSFLKATNVNSHPWLPKAITMADSPCLLVLNGNGRSKDAWSEWHGRMLCHNQTSRIICAVVSSATEFSPRFGTRRLLPDCIGYPLLAS